jgi:hypothetical protein
MEVIEIDFCRPRKIECYPTWLREANVILTSGLCASGGIRISDLEKVLTSGLCAWSSGGIRISDLEKVYLSGGGYHLISKK